MSEDGAEFKVDALRVQPGRRLGGQVRLTAGADPMTVSRTRIQVNCRNPTDRYDELGSANHLIYLDETVAADTRVRDSGSVLIPFRIRIPWATALTESRGKPIYPVTMDIRLIAERADRPALGQIQRLRVVPLPGQLAVLNAAVALGAEPKTSSLFAGGQIFELPGLSGRTGSAKRLALTTTEHTLAVSWYELGGPTVDSIELTHDQAATEPWPDRLGEWFTRRPSPPLPPLPPDPAP
ncbi:sporulation protein [Nocardia sp. NPDC057668]|uniref:sporulation protein n=1 Tax=Nocardia sp. NPDC057668 TaxID=3346202 RepID=UPI0036735DB5